MSQTDSTREALLGEGQRRARTDVTWGAYCLFLISGILIFFANFEDKGSCRFELGSKIPILYKQNLSQAYLVHASAFAGLSYAFINMICMLLELLKKKRMIPRCLKRRFSFFSENSEDPIVHRNNSKAMTELSASVGLFTVLVNFINLSLRIISAYTKCQNMNDKTCWRPMFDATTVTLHVLATIIFIFAATPTYRYYASSVVREDEPPEEAESKAGGDMATVRHRR